jgi:hypothetical protein
MGYSSWSTCSARSGSIRLSDSTIVGQIRSQVTLLIADGRIEPGSRLPAVRTLAELLEINVNTVRSAYAGSKRMASSPPGMAWERSSSRSTPAPSSPAASRYLSNTVGVLIAGLDPFYLEMLRGIEAKADEQGWLVLIFDSQDSSPARPPPPAAHGTWRAGIIAVSIGAPRGGLGEDALPPIVYVDHPVARARSCCSMSIGLGTTPHDTCCSMAIDGSDSSAYPSSGRTSASCSTAIGGHSARRASIPRRGRRRSSKTSGSPRGDRGLRSCSSG